MSHLTDTVGHRIRKAMDIIAGKPTGRLEPTTGRRSNTFRLTTMNDVPGMEPEQSDFIMAIINFKRYNRREPDLLDAFHIAKALGYRKV